MSYQLLSRTEPVARKEYRCIWCPEKILKGEKHVHEFSKYEGDFQDHRWHSECKKAANSYFSKYGAEEFLPHDFKRGTDVEAEREWSAMSDEQPALPRCKHDYGPPAMCPPCKAESSFAAPTGLAAAKREAAFYRKQLELICKDSRKTRARRLAESALTFWDSLKSEAAKREWPPFAESLCSPTTTWVCPACGRWYQTIRKRDELPLSAKRRCIEQHIEEGCRAYTEQSANTKLTDAGTKTP